MIVRRDNMSHAAQAALARNINRPTAPPNAAPSAGANLYQATLRKKEAEVKENWHAERTKVLMKVCHSFLQDNYVIDRLTL